MGHRYKTCFKDRSKIWDAFLKFNENFFLSLLSSFSLIHSFSPSLSLFHLFSLSPLFHDSFLTQVVCQRIVFFIPHSSFSVLFSSSSILYLHSLSSSSLPFFLFSLSFSIPFVLSSLFLLVSIPSQGNGWRKRIKLMMKRK